VTARYVTELPNEAATAAVGSSLAAVLPERAVVYLEGDLGAGKTTLVRALLRALGHAGAVRSPTYTLIEPYQVSGHSIYHLDLYRLSHPEELEDIGIRDILALPCILLVEWPERGVGALPRPDLRLSLSAAGKGRTLEARADTRTGGQILQQAGLVC
jgi:tRNA threonylcarbamoyladenosine biosynthesis protein TsaE